MTICGHCGQEIFEDELDPFEPGDIVVVRPGSRYANEYNAAYLVVNPEVEVVLRAAWSDVIDADERVIIGMENGHPCAINDDDLLYMGSLRDYLAGL